MWTGAALRGQPQALTPVIAPDEPQDVAIPNDFQGNPIDFFDDFSWKMFLTLVWPADPALRGAPDRNRPITSDGPVVFETFKTNWETFQPGGAAPPAYDAVAPSSPCGTANVPAGAPVIAAFSKFEELRLAGFGALAGPLLAQNGTYTRYATGYNRTQYEHIVAKKLYLQSQLGNVTFPNGSVVVKAAWKEMTGSDDSSQYHTQRAWVIDPASGSCSERLLGLVGLHIVKKTPSRPQWIWSSFEHVNTAPDAGSAVRMDYNDGSGEAMPSTNPFAVPEPGGQAPFNIERLKPVHSSTEATNAKYRNALATLGSVWKNYRLVMTQWPLSVGDPTKNGKPGNTFPGNNSDQTAFANTTMEPFEQATIQSGCMACHDLTRRKTDFVWSIATHAFAAPSPFLSVTQEGNDRGLRDLKQLMESAERAHRDAQSNRKK